MQLFWGTPLLAFGIAAAGQSFVSPPRNIKTVPSERWAGASIEYKQVNKVCETKENVASYSGYVRLPSHLVPEAGGAEGLAKDDVASYFFWYFEARNDPENAPTAIYFGGGPGYSGYDGSSVFPCYFNDDGNSTTLNEDSWNNNVNMLYVDNPVGVGFSYVRLENGTLHTNENQFEPVLNNSTGKSVTDVVDLPEISLSKIPATMHVFNESTAVNSTMAAARIFWKFSQVWFSDFPERRTKNDEISLWGVSYAGFYTAMFTSYFLAQNEIIEAGGHELKNATSLNIATVGIVNGMTDIEAMAFGFLDFAMNNTFGQPILEEKDYTTAMTALHDDEGGCLHLLQQCRAAQIEGDPFFTGTDPTVNKICSAASLSCAKTLIQDVDVVSQYYQFDISLKKPATYPAEHEAAFLNQKWVQEELGVPLNFSRGNSKFEMQFFNTTGDLARYDLSHLGNLLDSGINVALAFGDREPTPFPLGFSAENASLHIPFNGAKSFASAGYADIVTNSSYNGGLVREHGGLSFSRVFQAGHSAGGFQSGTMSKIFERAIFRKDVATGEVDVSETKGYASKGEADVRHVKHKLPDPIANVCYVLWTIDTCTCQQKQALMDGSAETQNGVVTSPQGRKDGETNEEREVCNADESQGDGDSDSDETGNEHGKGSNNSQGTSSRINASLGFVLASIAGVVALI